MPTYYLAPRVIYSEYTKKFGFPIYLRFSYRRKESMLATSIYIKEREYWNDELKQVVGGSNIKPKNDAIRRLWDEAEARLLKAIASGDGPSVSAFKGKTLKSFENYITKKASYNHAVGILKAIKGAYISVPDITQVTVKWLNTLEDYMYETGLGHGSVVNYMGGGMRTVLNKAVKEGYITQSPIGPHGYQVPIAKETDPTFLNTKERGEWLKALLENKFDGELHTVLAYFMLGCYSGLRYSDWVRFDPATRIMKDVDKDDMLILRAKKNKSLITLPIHKKSSLEKVINVIKKIGPLKIPYYKIIQHLETLVKELKVEKHIRPHSGRHSFGYMCASQKIPKETAAYYMGITVKVVEIYYHLTGEIAKEHSKKLAAA